MILGLSGGFGHDASACLMENGSLLAYAEEERLSRQKAAYGQAPVRATLDCLRRANAEAGDVTVVAFAWNPSLAPGLEVCTRIKHELMRDPRLSVLNDRPKVFFPHHDCHAIVSLMDFRISSPGPRQAVLVIDGRGETSSASIYKADGFRIERVAELDIADSLGSFYSAATRFAGFARGGEGSLMGLAGYFKFEHNFPQAFSNDQGDLHAAHELDSSIDLPLKHLEVRKSWFQFFEKNFGRPRQPKIKARGLQSEEFQHWSKFASWVQSNLEFSVLHLAKMSLQTTGCSELALSGGVALNCSANGRLRNLLGNSFHVHGLVGDAGAAIGAAALQSINEGASVQPLTHQYLGDEWSDEQVLQELSQLRISMHVPRDLPSLAADVIESGRAVSWFQGAAEAGPRALGHRSILADPTNVRTASSVNTLKGRASWRPLAPTMLKDEARKYFLSDGSPFMIEAVTALDSTLETLPAVVHCDGTSRIQIANREFTSPRLVTLLDQLGSRGRPEVVLNTSFNLEHEPIVNSPTDAVRTFYSSGLRDLFIGPAYVEKK